MYVVTDAVNCCRTILCHTCMQLRACHIQRMCVCVCGGGRDYDARTVGLLGCNISSFPNGHSCWCYDEFELYFETA